MLEQASKLQSCTFSAAHFNLMFYCVSAMLRAVRATGLAVRLSCYGIIATKRFQGIF